MTTTIYDPDLTARPIAEAKEDDARMTRAPWVGGADAVFEGGDPLLETVRQERHEADSSGVARTRNNLRALADQLEAARRHIEYLENVARAFVEQRKSLDAARVDASRVPGLTASLDEARWERDVALKREPAAGQALAEISRLRAELETANAARALAEARSNNLDSSHAARDATKLRISARLGLPATATQSEIAERVDEVVGERDAAWRSGVDASIRRLEPMSRKPRDLWHPAFFAAVDEALVHLRAILERGTERSGDAVMDAK
ncbi:MAG TPA: hypothetical protein VFT22_07505 [Kofleriaceae bacterium]|nr:hypothetical protein [Kofleriaceae bacterium]